MEVLCTRGGFFQHKINGATTCGTIGHFAKACQSKTLKSSSNGTSCIVFANNLFSHCHLSQKLVSGLCNHLGVQVKSFVLIDSGGSDSFINGRVVREQNLHIHPSSQDISMTLSMFFAPALPTVIIIMIVHIQPHVLEFSKNLCSNIILGQDFRRNTRVSLTSLMVLSLSWY